MLPQWAYGFFQSKDRYNSQEEILGIAHRYREEHIPLDAIVQDWFWWKTEGDPVFNSNFTDIPGELRQLHDEHVHAMLSVWGLFDTKAQNYQELTSKHFDVPNAHVYDSTNPLARDFYWNNLVSPLFSQGWDAFWLDSAEPEEYWPHSGDAILSNKQIAIGNGAEYTNVYPFTHTLGIQQHWRATTTTKEGFSPDALRIPGTTTRWSDGLVGRRLRLLLGPSPPSGRGAELCALRLSVLDYRHRRLLPTARKSAC